MQGDSLSGTTLVRDKFQDINSTGTAAVDNQAQIDFSLASIRQKILFGLDYQHADIFEKNTDSDAPSLDIFNPIYAQALPAYTWADTYLVTQQKLDQLGLYAQDQLAWGGWRANAGVRQDWIRSSTTNFLDNNALQKQSDKATTWRAGLLYLFDNGVAPYASYSTSFVPTIGTDAYSNAFKPTTGQQYEVGVKYQPTGFNAMFTASMFSLTEQNVITTDPNNPNNSIQTGEERSRGVELQSKVNLAENFNLTAAYTYLDAKVTQANDGTQGFRIWAIPRHAASLWADYKFTTDALAGLAFGAGVRYVGGTTDQSNTLSVPPFTLFDAMIRYDLGANAPNLKGLSLALNVTNLNDTKYIQQCVNGCYYGLRRQVLATLKYDW